MDSKLRHELAPPHELAQTSELASGKGRRHGFELEPKPGLEIELTLEPKPELELTLELELELGPREEARPMGELYRQGGGAWR